MLNFLRKLKKLYEINKQNESFLTYDNPLVSEGFFLNNLNNYEIYKSSIMLSIYLCYYLRLSKYDRKELAIKLNNIFGENFIEIPERIQEYIAKNIEINKAIAKNRNLLENLFAIFCCVNAKVPLFIIGESGSSKYLSFELIYSAMKGDISDNPFFKSFQKLFSNGFSVSLATTSLVISKIFKRARNICKNDYDGCVSMIFFSDIGLAEYSPNNPLQIIHSELDNNDFHYNKKISFVGTSNLFLDAPKMNRGIVLVVPKLNKKDLGESALAIAQYYNAKLAYDNKDLFFAFASTYFEYKEKLEKDYPKQKEFHGLRDFYHLINTAMKLLLKKKEKDLDLIIDDNIKQEIRIISIDRNFSGLELKSNNYNINSFKLFNNLFKIPYAKLNIKMDYNVLQRICDNLEDNKSRYLLLITKSSIIKYLVLSFFNSQEFKKKINKDFCFYEGSCFSKDISSEEYRLKILNKLQLQIEKNQILLLTI